MNRAFALTWLFLLPAAIAFSLSTPTPTRAGLYGDEGKDIQKGDLNDQDYWWTKYDMMMLDLAMKQHQPEGAIELQLASTQNRLNDLVKKYPKHEQLAEWKKKVEDISAKIDPNANRGTPFNPGCPWAESNFAQAWVNFYWSQMQAAANHRDDAIGLLQNVNYNLNLLTEKPDRLNDYPDDLKKWITDNKPVAAKLYKDLKAQAQH
ncbi:MAG TPA: hypothetical protein VFE58_17445 [Tepidisphaeraceae bacterium]|jgi:hypothetical protein|nr:hypothetical protein [Tepidisphaeraceae bacterium]